MNDPASITHYHAQIKGEGYYSPERSTLTDTMVLCFANDGNTPDRITPRLQQRADAIKAALLAGKMVETTTADISPLTSADFTAGRITPCTGCLRI
jgi:hypothetical protein